MAWQNNEVDGSLMIKFGDGDLRIAAAGEDPEIANELVIWHESEIEPIGRVDPGQIGKSTAEVKALVRLVFNDPRSLDVFIHQAQELRSLMSDSPKWMPESE